MKKKLTPEEEASKIDRNKDLHEYFSQTYTLERFHSIFHDGKDGNWTNQVNMKGRDIPPIYFLLREREEEILRLTKFVALTGFTDGYNGALDFIKESEESKLKQENQALKERNRHLETMFESIGLLASQIERITETVKEQDK